MFMAGMAVAGRCGLQVVANSSSDNGNSRANDCDMSKDFYERRRAER